MNLFLAGMIFIDILGIGFTIFNIYKPEWTYKINVWIAERDYQLFRKYYKIPLVEGLLKTRLNLFKKYGILFTRIVNIIILIFILQIIIGYIMFPATY